MLPIATPVAEEKYEQLFTAFKKTVDNSLDKFAQYKYTPADYIQKYLGWEPWSGKRWEATGQLEIIEIYADEIVKQERKQSLEKQALKIRTDMDEITSPTMLAEKSKELSKIMEELEKILIRNWIRVESGHSVGKTKVSSGIVQHFFDCFPHSITYCFAPTYSQVNDLLFKEIRASRGKNRELLGRVFSTPDLRREEPENKDWFVKGKAVGGQTTEAVHGQHNDYMLFLIDEAEGVPDFVYEAIRSMSAGAISIVLMLANPRTSTSYFHRLRGNKDTHNLRISCLHHPNVVYGADIIRGAVNRAYVTAMVEQHCNVVEKHNPDLHTFTLPYETSGNIYAPNNEFMFRVLGVAPTSASNNSFVPLARFENALSREWQSEGKPNIAFIGWDVARYGNDEGICYVFHDGLAYHASSCSKMDGYEYYIETKAVIEELAEKGVDEVHIRIDVTGSHGSSLIDFLSYSEDLPPLDYRFIAVSFGNNPIEENLHKDTITELYHHASETLKYISIEKSPSNNYLEADLTRRIYGYAKRGGRDVYKLEKKEDFRKREGRSPDFGDAFVLAVAPERLFDEVIEVGYA
jgi:hypothetical protein